MSDTAIEVYGGTQISLHRPPEDVLAEATKAANALTTVLQNKPNKVMFNGEQYLEREDWGTVAKFYGCTAKVTETRYVSFGDVTGWEATAVCIDRNLNEIGRAESMCLSDEENWGAVPIYEYQDELGPDGKKIWLDSKKRYKAKRVQVGTKPKPQFQLRSMAQTRAEAKALKSVFGWVVVLAGFKTTPAEEMTGDEQGHEDDRDERAPVTQPKRESEKAKPELAAIAGVIESAKVGKEGAVWFTVDKKIVVLKADLANESMAVGGTLSIRAVRQSSERLPEYYVVVEVVEAAPPQAGIGGGGGAPQAASTEKQAEFVQELDSAMSEPGINLGELMDEKGVQKASDLPANGSGKIGPKRAQKLYALSGINKASNNGLNEANLKKIIARMTPPLEHLGDLPMDLYGTFEKLATGEQDWRPLLED